MRKVVLIKHLFLNLIIFFRRMKCISKIKPTNTQISLINKVFLLFPGVISVIQLVNHILWPIITIFMVPNLISWLSLKDSTAQIVNNLWIFLLSEEKKEQEGQENKLFFSHNLLLFNINFYFSKSFLSLNHFYVFNLFSLLVALYLPII